MSLIRLGDSWGEASFGCFLFRCFFFFFSVVVGDGTAAVIGVRCSAARLPSLLELDTSADTRLRVIESGDSLRIEVDAVCSF